MEKQKPKFDVFVFAALLVIGAAVFIFIEYYFNRDFAVFTTEDEIAEAVTAEFPHLAQYLFADYLP